MAFACPPDCGHCCTHLEREPEPGAAEFQAVLRVQGVYSCDDGMRVGLSLSNAEASALLDEASRRGMRVAMHPRTYLIETRRRAAVVLDWHMPSVVCPFYADFRCTVYERRPLVCRAYPVLQIGKRGLAPECPKMPVPAAELRAERRVRRAIDEAHARVDEDAWRAMERGRFAKGLSAREAARRLERYRHVALDEFLAVEARTARAKSSTS